MRNATTESPLEDDVARQYERFPYPQPVASLDELGGLAVSDPRHQHLLYWPDRDYPHGMDILIAGCGANQAANIALRNPSARVFGIDVSTASLANQQRLKEHHGLYNLTLERLPIEHAASLGRSFDLIISTGVLHHMADPDLGMRVLGSLLKPDGVFAVMLYSKYGRVGVDALSDLFRTMGLDQSSQSVSLIRETFGYLSPTHPIRQYLALQPNDLNTEAGVVDSFLHPRARNYAVPDILRMAEDSGLAFQGWHHNHLYYPERLPADCAPYQALAKLAERDLWAAMELFHAADNAAHYFFVCRQDRPVDRYRIDFESDRFTGYIPIAAPGLDIVTAPESASRPIKLRRRGMEPDLNPAQSVAFSLVDGRRSIRQIADAMHLAGVKGAPEQFIGFTRVFFRTLWRLGLIYVRLQHDA